MIYNSGLNSES